MGGRPPYGKSWIRHCYYSLFKEYFHTQIDPFSTFLKMADDDNVETIMQVGDLKIDEGEKA